MYVCASQVYRKQSTDSSATYSMHAGAYGNNSSYSSLNISDNHSIRSFGENRSESNNGQQQHIGRHVSNRQHIRYPSPHDANRTGGHASGSSNSGSSNSDNNNGSDSEDSGKDTMSEYSVDSELRSGNRHSI